LGNNGFYYITENNVIKRYFQIEYKTEWGYEWGWEEDFDFNIILPYSYENVFFL